MYTISSASVVRALIGIGLVVGWGMLLFPLKRRLRRSRSSLLLVSGVMSLVCVFARQALEPEFMTEEFFLQTSVYVFGIFLGMVLVRAYLGIEESPPPVAETPAVAGESVREPAESPAHERDTGERISLRRFFQVALMLKERSQRYFEELARKINPGEIRDICLYLAKEHQTQKEQLQTQLQHWKSRPMSKDDLLSFAEQLERLDEFFPKNAGPDSIPNLLAMAMEQEKKVIGFFRSFAGDYQKPWKSMKIQDLIKKEERLAELLHNVLDQKSEIALTG
jgi:rubrerythrin